MPDARDTGSLILEALGPGPAPAGVLVERIRGAHDLNWRYEPTAKEIGNHCRRLDDVEQVDTNRGAVVWGLRRGVPP